MMHGDGRGPTTFSSIRNRTRRWRLPPRVKTKRRTCSRF
ncbi:hypothetical protein [Kribbella sp. CA-293567]